MPKTVTISHGTILFKGVHFCSTLNQTSNINNNINNINNNNNNINNNNNNNNNKDKDNKDKDSALCSTRQR